MPRIKVNGVSLAYEILGKGPTIVWTPGGRFPRDNWTYLSAGCYVANYQNLLWDRRNSGASDSLIEEAASEVHLWTDDLHHLLAALNMSPVYLAGVSGGNLFSLLMAHRYPADVKGLILLDTQTNDVNLIRSVFDVHYLRLAEIAEREGMQAVIDFSKEAMIRIASAQSKPEDFDWVLNWVAATISRNPANQDRFLAMDAQKFATQLRNWGEQGVQWAKEGRGHICGLSEEEVRRIMAPALILQGFDIFHPRQPAEDLHRLLPNSQWVEYSEYYAVEEINRVKESDSLHTQRVVMNRPIIESFLQRVESQKGLYT